MRAFLTIAVPLLLPIAIYAVWLLVQRRFFPGTVNNIQAGGGVRAWSLAFLGGAVLAVAALLVIGLEGDEAPAGRYVPAVVKDGRIVPGHNEPR